MYPHKQELDLPKLRRQLEELLSMVATDPSFERGSQNECDHLSGTEAAGSDSQLAASICPPTNENSVNATDRDPLSDDALVVITEFGHASAAILQMWLSIDYRRAIKILSQFQADGLISAKGRVRHKAFVLRHSLGA
ncbi:MAG TPA: DNA translocase FtsK [Blastocatellia bacterium]|nr:DNA translocase FtsK [Blastocatellia bacterium]